MDEQIKMADFIAVHRISADAAPTGHNPNMDSAERMDHWRITLRRPGRKMTVYFSMGTGHHGKMPEAADVLDCLVSDASSVANAQGFEDWAAELGYDTDSRKAHRTYTICQRQADRLKKFMGDEAYETLLWNTDR